MHSLIVAITIVLNCNDWTGNDKLSFSSQRTINIRFLRH